MTTRRVPYARLFTAQGCGVILPVKSDAQAARICLTQNAYAFTMMRLDCAVQDTEDGEILTPLPQEFNESAMRYVGVTRLYICEDITEELTALLQQNRDIPLAPHVIHRLNTLRDTFNDLNTVLKRHKATVSYVLSPFSTYSAFAVRDYLPLNDNQKVYDAQAKLIWPVAKPRKPKLPAPQALIP